MIRSIAAWFVVALMANAALASDLCLPVATLQFKGQHISRLCQSQIPRLLDHQLDFQGMMGPLRAGTSGPPLDTCNQYINLVGIGKLAPSRMESWTEYSIYMHTCGTLFAAASAHKPMKSFIGENPIDLTMLPPTQLPNGPTGDAQDELEASFARGESAEDFLRSLEKQSPAFNRKKYLTGWKMVLLARADFDGDGIEDALVSYSDSPTGPDEHYFWYGIGVLIRTSSIGPAKWIDFNDFKWTAPNIMVKRDVPDAVRPSLKGSASH